MTRKQWEILNRVLEGERIEPMPIGFIIDSPWLPNWYGVNILDYFSNDEIWLNANLKAANEFPEVIFLPGFWSEFGMCTEPSAFGARSSFPQNEFPHADKVIQTIDQIESLPEPDPETDGLLPFVMNRLKISQPKIEDAGHQIKFAVARGPLNIASYLMGTTELLTAIMTSPESAKLLIRKITNFLKKWIQLQRETFPTIDGVFLLDDIIGFIGAEEFKSFGLPYFSELYDTDVSVKFLHNDAPCRESAPLLNDIGINFFNMGFDASLNELKEITRNQITMLGNLPPRDVLAKGTEKEVFDETRKMIEGLDSPLNIIPSCGGGMPNGVSSANLRSFVNAVKHI